MYQAQEIIIPLAAFAMVFGIVYLGVTSMHRKEIAMIEAGMNPVKSQAKKHSKIRTALLILLVPVGILLGNFLSPYMQTLDTAEAGLLFGFIFGGIALVTSYFLERVFEKNTEED